METLPPNVVKAFVALGNAQRGAPEEAMIKVQFAMGGGVINPVVEHVGDITHRMTEMLRYYKGEGTPDSNLVGYDLVKDKTHKGLKYLTNSYGFEREFNQNIINAATAREKPIEEVRERITKALRRYALEHRRLVVYNRPQYAAKFACVHIGLEEWDKAINMLEFLSRLCDNKKRYVEEVCRYELDSSGNVKPFTGK